MIYRFNAISTKIPMMFFPEIVKKKNPKISVGPQKTLKKQSNPEQKEQSRRHYTTRP